MKFKKLLKEPRHNYSYKKIPVIAKALNEPNIDRKRLQQGFFDMVLYDNGKAVIRIGCREDCDKYIDEMAESIEKTFFKEMDKYIESHMHTTLLQRWFESKNSIRQDDEVYDEIQGVEMDWVEQ